jgi:hypothetical protein
MKPVYLNAIPCGRAGPDENAVLKSSSNRTSRHISPLLVDKVIHELEHRLAQLRTQREALASQGGDRFGRAVRAAPTGSEVRSTDLGGLGGRGPQRSLAISNDFQSP